MSDFHRTSPKMAWLRLRRIANKSTETENCYENFNRELCWLWNSVYLNSFVTYITQYLLVYNSLLSGVRNI